MKMLLLSALLSSAIALPVFAQHAGHSAHSDHGPTPAAEKPKARTDPHAGHQMAAPEAVSPTKPADSHLGHDQEPKPQPTTKPVADPHAGHNAKARIAPSMSASEHDVHKPATNKDAGHAGHQNPPVPAAADPHAGHKTSPAKVENHQGHDMGAGSHAGHDMSMPEGHDMTTPMGHSVATPAPPRAPAPPQATNGARFAADTSYDQRSMARSREELRREHGDMNISKLTIDQLEAVIRNGRAGYAWEDAQFTYGGDINKLWLKSEGEVERGGRVEHAEVQALWSRSISPWWDLQAGLRYDIRPKPDRGYLVLGIQGLAPYWFEVDAAAFVSNKGDVTARLETEYDQRITQKLILQPRAELEFSAQDIPELDTGSGLTSAEAGLRLRYEFVPEFAPYVGVQYERALGETADYRRADGEDVGGWSVLLGVRAWF